MIRLIIIITCGDISGYHWCIIIIIIIIMRTPVPGSPEVSFQRRCLGASIVAFATSEQGPRT
jgi:hypothetical protein